jgi:hypothetical protein
MPHLSMDGDAECAPQIGRLRANRLRGDFSLGASHFTTFTYRATPCETIEYTVFIYTMVYTNRRPVHLLHTSNLIRNLEFSIRLLLDLLDLHTRRNLRERQTSIRPIDFEYTLDNSYQYIIFFTAPSLTTQPRITYWPGKE